MGTATSVWLGERPPAPAAPPPIKSTTVAHGTTAPKQKPPAITRPPPWMRNEAGPVRSDPELQSTARWEQSNHYHNYSELVESTKHSLSWGSRLFVSGNLMAWGHHIPDARDPNDQVFWCDKIEKIGANPTVRDSARSVRVYLPVRLVLVYAPPKDVVSRGRLHHFEAMLADARGLLGLIENYFNNQAADKFHGEKTKRHKVEPVAWTKDNDKTATVVLWYGDSGEDTVAENTALDMFKTIERLRPDLSSVNDPERHKYNLRMASGAESVFNLEHCVWMVRRPINQFPRPVRDNNDRAPVGKPSFLKPNGPSTFPSVAAFTMYGPRPSRSTSPRWEDLVAGLFFREAQKCDVTEQPDDISVAQFESEKRDPYGKLAGCISLSAHVVTHRVEQNTAALNTQLLHALNLEAHELRAPAQGTNAALLVYCRPQDTGIAAEVVSTELQKRPDCRRVLVVFVQVLRNVVLTAGTDVRLPALSWADASSAEERPPVELARVEFGTMVHPQGDKGVIRACTLILDQGHIAVPSDVGLGDGKVATILINNRIAWRDGLTNARRVLLSEFLDPRFADRFEYRE